MRSIPSKAPKLENTSFVKSRSKLPWRNASKSSPPASKPIANSALLTAANMIPTILSAADLAMEKVFGEIKSIEAGFSRGINAGEWRLKKDLAGGGPLMDVGIYALQTCRFVSGREPIEVTGKFGPVTDSEKFAEVEESVEWEMTFPGGLKTTCKTNYEESGMHNFTVTAEKGSFGLDPAYYYNSSSGTRSDGQAIDLPSINQFAAEMDDFAQCIINNKSSEISGEEGLRDVKIMMAIYESARSGKPVKLA